MMFVIVLIAVISVCAYISLISYMLYVWNESPDFIPSKKEKPSFSYSILIAARNEEERIVSCLNSISRCPLFDLIQELILVDDHSDDNTVSKALSLNIDSLKVLSLKHMPAANGIIEGKKHALIHGIKNSNSDYIIQLDADVLVGEAYLRYVISFLEEEKPDFVAMPVLLTGDTGFEDFQSLDYAGMMILTQAGIQSQLWYMANGANMAYRRDQLQTFNTEKASGDDIYGIQDVRSRGGKVMFLKSAMASVTTAAEKTWRGFYRQRLRWASKNKYMDLKMKIMMAIPFLNKSLLVAYPLLMILSSQKWIIMILMVHHMFFVCLFDYLLLREAAAYFKIESKLKEFISAQIYHTLYIAVVGFISLFVSDYTWKGRRVK